MEGSLQTGDVVRHALLDTEKIVVGVGEDRYLCVHLEDVDPYGHLRPNARVAMHRGVSLHKVGHREGILGVDLHHLYQGEGTSRHTFLRRLLRERILIQALFLLAFLFIILAVVSWVDALRFYFEQLFSRISNMRKGLV